MNTRRLEALLAIVRCGSFAAASEQLNMTQSAISLRIRELEEELGTTIFDRSRRRAELTSEGRQLVQYAAAVVSAVNDMKYAIGDKELLAGTVRLGVTELVAVTWLPALVNVLRQRFPRLQLELKVGLASDVVDQIARGQLDIGLTPGLSFAPEFESVSLGTVDFQWVAAPSLLEAGWTWDLSSSSSPSVLLLAEKSFINEIADAWFRERQIFPRHIDTCNSMNVLAALVAGGLGVSLLPTFCYLEEIASRKFQLVDPEVRIAGTFYALFHRHNLSATTRAVAALCGELSTFPQIERPNAALTPPADFGCMARP